MQALILVGGFATRLRPLTDKRPKALLPILNKPMIVHLIDKVSSLVDEVILAVNYGKEHLDRYFQEHDVGVPVRLNPESEPLGTGGAIKNAKNLINDTFFVFNGDVITSLDLQWFLKFHRSKKGIGALSLWHVDDPSRFGIIAINDQNQITRFLEKPKPSEIFSHLINAGTYCLEPEILDLIPSGRKVSIEREIFPNILDKNLYGVEFSGYWFDAGTPEIYLEAHKQMLDYYLKRGELKDLIGAGSIIASSAEIADTVLMGENCRISDNVEVGPYVFLGDNVEIGPCCKISHAVIHDGTRLKENVIGTEFILGLENVIFSGLKLPKGLVTSDNFTANSSFS